MTISITPPLPKTLNVVPSSLNDASGALTPGDTWYFKICASNSQVYTNHFYPPYVRGQASTEVSVVIGSGHNAVSLAWDAVTGATWYSVYARKSTESDYAQRRCFPTSTPWETYNATTNTNSYTFRNASYRGMISDTAAVIGSYAMPGGLNRDYGVLHVNLSGACGSVTYAQIEAALVAAGYGAASATPYHDWSPGQYVLKGSITIAVGATGTLDFRSFNAVTGGECDYPTICCLQGAVWNIAPSTFTVYLDNCRYVPMGHSLHIYLDGFSALNAQIMGTNVFFSTPLVGSADHYTHLSPTTGNIRGLALFGTILSLHVSVTGIDAHDAPMATYDNNLVLTEVKNFGTFICYSGASYTGVKLIRCSNTGGYAWRPFSNGGTARFIECTFYTGVDPINQWDTVSYSDAKSEIAVYCNVIVLNNAGMPIQSATVSVKNKNGTQVFSPTTGIDGKIAQQELVLADYRWNGVTPRPCSASGTLKTSYAPFTVEVSLAGYRTFRAIWSPTAGINECVVLEPIVGDVTDPMPPEEMHLNWNANEPISGFEVDECDERWKVGGPQ